MAKKRKKKVKSKNSYKKIIIFSGVILFLLWYYMPWQMLNKDMYVEYLPYRDLNAPYSAGYDGVDISRPQGTIPCDVLSHNSPIKFIYIKAT